MKPVECLHGGCVLQLVALGRVLALLPESVGRQVRRDVVCVPVPDAPAIAMLLAWRARDRSRALATFVRTAMTLAAGT
ncbi:LysR substrate-binding domain-containing protein [Dactylosporangium sp. NPDC051484]|uniref:LysR substrate-binding domain-containing protein n=1 Tax=Dactylosporangium sp. NPDC051484 TaxID=3154942 RepID=UPI00345052C3